MDVGEGEWVNRGYVGVAQDGGRCRALANAVINSRFLEIMRNFGVAE
jgi:hypothetical protein